MLESQKLVLWISSGLTGLLIGSFLNVCIFRLPRNCMSIVRPRSRCPKCLRWITWYDNLPVVSWVLLGGKCRGCRAPISPRYALVELLTGAVFGYAGWRALYGVPSPGWHEAVRFGVEAWFMSCLIVCTFIDYDFQILPDEITLSGIALGLVLSAAFPFLHETGLPLQDHAKSLARFFGGHPWLASLAASAFGALLGAGVIYFADLLGKLLFRKEGMGMGDVKYVAMFGAVLGWKGALLGFMVACLAGAIFGIGKLIAVRRMGYVPFGPFLSAGAAVIVFWPTLVVRAIFIYMGWMHSLSAWTLQLFGVRPV
ncbi:MAG TPA: prepilin peptidase [Planctomycetota bacterium]|nr:prepilin peptidase [Planctomycetota bacterium]